jgi:GNAT superfamily N-acetyltransferase
MEDFTSVQSILNDRCRWLAQRRIEQWPGGGFDDKIIKSAIDQDATYLVRVGKEIVGTFVITDSDATWGDFPGSAVYIRRMATHTSWGGRDIGGAILAWIAEYAREDGKQFVRLAAPINDGALPKYYTRNGFEQVAEIETGGHLCALMERATAG